MDGRALAAAGQGAVVATATHDADVVDLAPGRVEVAR